VSGELLIEPREQPTVPLDRLLGFTGFLAANGVPVDPGAQLDALRIAALTGLSARVPLRHALRACLTGTPETFRRFDLLFDAYFQPDGERADLAGVERPDATAGGVSRVAAQKLLGMAGTSEKQRQEEESFGAGDFKALSLADFRFVFDPRQRQRIERLVDEMARRARRRATRAHRIAARGSRPDMRRTLRRSLGTCGHPAELRFRQPRRRLERFVLLLDISQSMDVYARLFLRFVRVLMTVFTESHAFAFNTDLVRLGRGHAKLSERDFEAIMNATGKGWLGGTRIAHAFETFEAGHAARLLDRRTTLVVFSDGCDTSPPERLADITQRLGRRPRRLVWVNPLLGRYAPGQENRWMDPVAPHVDAYLSAHCLDSLVALERELLGQW